MNALQEFRANLSRPDLTWTEKLAHQVYLHSQFEQYECPVTHLFQDGWYIREMMIPKGTIFIGRPHLHGHKVELLKGTVLHFEEQGKATRKAPYTVTTHPGYQAVFFTASEVVGRTYHPDHGERDTDLLEQQIFVPVEAVIALGSRIHQRELAAA
jgi:hypothetical protein